MDASRVGVGNGAVAGSAPVSRAISSSGESSGHSATTTTTAARKGKDSTMLGKMVGPSRGNNINDANTLPPSKRVSRPPAVLPSAASLPPESTIAAAVVSARAAIVASAVSSMAALVAAATMSTTNHQRDDSVSLRRDTPSKLGGRLAGTTAAAGAAAAAASPASARDGRVRGTSSLFPRHAPWPLEGLHDHDEDESDNGDEEESNDNDDRQDGAVSTTTTAQGNGKPPNQGLGREQKERFCKDHNIPGMLGILRGRECEHPAGCSRMATHAPPALGGDNAASALKTGADAGPTAAAGGAGDRVGNGVIGCEGEGGGGGGVSLSSSPSAGQARRAVAAAGGGEREGAFFGEGVAGDGRSGGGSGASSEDATAAANDDATVTGATAAATAAVDPAIDSAAPAGCASANAAAAGAGVPGVDGVKEAATGSCAHDGECFDAAAPASAAGSGGGGGGDDAAADDAAVGNAVVPGVGRDASDVVAGEDVDADGGGGSEAVGARRATRCWEHAGPGWVEVVGLDGGSAGGDGDVGNATQSQQQQQRPKRRKTSAATCASSQDDDYYYGEDYDEEYMAGESDADRHYAASPTARGGGGGSSSDAVPGAVVTKGRWAGKPRGVNNKCPHPNSKHYCHGQCKLCYMKEYNRKTRVMGFVPGGKPVAGKPGRKPAASKKPVPGRGEQRPISPRPPADPVPPPAEEAPFIGLRRRRRPEQKTALTAAAAATAEEKGMRKSVSNCEHKDAPHYGKGFCRPCYMREYNRAKKRGGEVVRLPSRNRPEPVAAPVAVVERHSGTTSGRGSNWAPKTTALPAPLCADCGQTEKSWAVVLICDGCEATFHLGCKGRSDQPRGEWFCPSCTAILLDSDSDCDDPERPSASPPPAAASSSGAAARASSHSSSSCLRPSLTASSQRPVATTSNTATQASPASASPNGTPANGSTTEKKQPQGSSPSAAATRGKADPGGKTPGAATRSSAGSQDVGGGTSCGRSTGGGGSVAVGWLSPRPDLVFAAREPRAAAVPTSRRGAPATSAVTRRWLLGGDVRGCRCPICVSILLRSGGVRAPEASEILVPSEARAMPPPPVPPCAETPTAGITAAAVAAAAAAITARSRPGRRRQRQRTPIPPTLDEGDASEERETVAAPRRSAVPPGAGVTAADTAGHGGDARDPPGLKVEAEEQGVMGGEVGATPAGRPAPLHVDTLEAPVSPPRERRMGLRTTRQNRRRPRGYDSSSSGEGGRWGGVSSESDGDMGGRGSRGRGRRGFHSDGSYSMSSSGRSSSSGDDEVGGGGRRPVGRPRKHPAPSPRGAGGAVENEALSGLTNGEGAENPAGGAARGDEGGGAEGGEGGAGGGSVAAGNPSPTEFAPRVKRRRASPSTSRKGVVTACKHTDRELYSRGTCKPCYMVAYWNRKHAELGIKPRIPRSPTWGEKKKATEARKRTREENAAAAELADGPSGSGNIAASIASAASPAAPAEGTGIDADANDPTPRDGACDGGGGGVVANGGGAEGMETGGSGVDDRGHDGHDAALKASVASPSKAAIALVKVEAPLGDTRRAVREGSSKGDAGADASCKETRSDLDIDGHERPGVAHKEASPIEIGDQAGCMGGLIGGHQASERMQPRTLDREGTATIATRVADAADGVGVSSGKNVGKADCAEGSERSRPGGQLQQRTLDAEGVDAMAATKDAGVVERKSVKRPPPAAAEAGKIQPTGEPAAKSTKLERSVTHSAQVALEAAARAVSVSASTGRSQEQIRAAPGAGAGGAPSRKATPTNLTKNVAQSKPSAAAGSSVLPAAV